LKVASILDPLGQQISSSYLRAGHLQEEYEDLIGNIHITCCILITHTTVLGDNFTSPAITNAPIYGLETYKSVL